ncbi:hypothetical protein [Mycolicibacter icosiumassiliensis]|uniref:hypothetical protein n=1 Tax=Mycolicibacter icosiumassiliensis TaxID=1792835 RepID=UPI0012B6A3A5|nr:hypothetical protein [Mycolicibacter icosiumassiliensis]
MQTVTEPMGSGVLSHCAVTGTPGLRCRINRRRQLLNCARRSATSEIAQIAAGRSTPNPAAVIILEATELRDPHAHAVTYPAGRWQQYGEPVNPMSVQLRD